MENLEITIDAGFMATPRRELFRLVLHPAGVKPRGAVLFLHAFAEEMHMSRRNVAQQARALAAAGYAVMLLDLTGCGDGDGDFCDATWSIWQEDARRALQDLRDRFAVPVTLWGMRCGALIAAQLSRDEPDIDQLLLWQPVLNGEQQVDQFLRLKATGGVLDTGKTFDRKQLWSELRAGQTLEVAGYLLSSAMALELAGVRLFDLIPNCRAHWLEVSPLDGSEVSVPSRRCIDHWSEVGVDVQSSCVAGSPFWRNHDAPINTALLQATQQALT